jgi:hypothetical protein
MKWLAIFAVLWLNTETGETIMVQYEPMAMKDRKTCMFAETTKGEEEWVEIENDRDDIDHDLWIAIAARGQCVLGIDI